MTGPSPHAAPMPGMRAPWRAGSLLVLPIGVLAADILLLQPAAPGLSLGLAALGVAALLLWRGQARGPGALAALAALAASAAQSAIEVTAANLLALVVLTALLLGATRFAALPGPWSRLGAALLAWRGIPRALHVALRLARGRFWQVSGIARLLAIILPAMLLAVVFALLLGSGNAVFGAWLVEALSGAIERLARLDIAPGRILAWLVIALLLLGLLRPARAPAMLRAPAREIPPWHRGDARLARLQSIGVLLLLNTLFLATNAIDAAYLWFSGALPPGVSHSVFVHEGTNALILAVLLSATVLVAIFRQAPIVTRGAWLRGLALLWIAQNLVLLGSVALRLGRYVDAYQLTELRVHLALFLALVAIGFVLLARHALGRIDLRRLVLGNLAALGALVFVVQFADIGGFIADTNLRVWRQRLATDQTAALDLDYLARLGPAAYPALRRVAEEPRAPAMAKDASDILFQLLRLQRAALAVHDWRSIQWRPDGHRRAFIAWSAEAAAIRDASGRQRRHDTPQRPDPDVAGAVERRSAPPP